MNTRTLIAAATLTIFAGAAAAEGESHIDYTNMYSSNSRAEVMAQASNQMSNSSSIEANEAYGSIDPQTVTSEATRAQVMAEAFDFRIDNTSSSYIMTNEAYNGVPALDMSVGSRAE